MEMIIKVALFIIVLIGYFASNVSSFRIFPPKIYSVYHEQVVDSNGNLTLECDGMEPVIWTYPNNTIMGRIYIYQRLYAEILKTPFPTTDLNSSSTQNEDYWSAVTVNVTTTSDKKYKYKTLLTMSNASYVDTGFYYCHGETASKNDPQRSSKIYVYVRDPNHLSLSSDGFNVIPAVQYANVTIPCIPTSPDVDVQLKDGNGDVVLSERAPYDPRYGFMLLEVTLSEPSYECIFSRNGQEFIQTILLDVQTTPKSVNKPYIDAPNDGRTTIGKTLELKCNVVVDRGVYFVLNWTIPNQLRWNTNEVNATTAVRSIEETIGTSMLTIKNVTYEDQGEYECKVTDHQNNTNQMTKNIIVFGPNGSHINLTESNNLYEIVEEAGKDVVQWVIKIDAYPVPELMWKDNEGKEIIINYPKSNYTSMIKMGENEAVLKIHNIQLYHSGTYQLVADNKIEQQVLNLTLNVEEKPIARIISDNYHKIGESSSFKCEAIGNPTPNILWWYKPCQNDECEFDLMNRKNYTSKSAGFKTVSEINLTIFETGLIKCEAENKKGVDITVHGIFITDIDDINSGFKIWRSNDKSKVAVGDTVTVSCAVSAYNYSENINWYWRNSSDIYQIYGDNKYTIIKAKTKYTYRSELTIDSITHKDGGSYYCEVDKDITQLEIKVYEPKTPKIIDSNMNKTTTKAIDQTVLFQCYADGIPFPTIYWLKDGKDLESSSRVKLYENNQKFEYLNIKQEDQGIYTCVAKNRISSVEMSTELIVLGPNKISNTLVTIIVFLVILFIVLVTVLILKIRKEKKLRRELKLAGLANFDKGALECLNPDLGVDEQAELLPYDKKFEFPRDRLKLGKQLGSGAFGVVMKAEAFGLVEDESATIVAVKMVKRNADSTYIKALASELKIMVHLGKHLNVVNLLGACTKNVTKRELLVIVEYCRFGNLHNYLLRHRTDFVNQIDLKTGLIDVAIGAEILNRTFSVSSNQSASRAIASGGLDYRYTPNPSSCETDSTAVCTPTGEDTFILSNNSVQPEWRSNYRGDYKENVRPISTHDLLCWAFQVARGMEYLASRKVLHGDLAARNILLSEENIVKICDFGLAKSMYKSDNYKKKGDGPLPVKWMAVESIRDRVFSTQSDVWSFGIVLWEFFSLAKTPYPGMDADERLYNKLVDGYRMEQPEYATKEIYQLMTDCWHAKPGMRPSFTKLSENLGCMLQESVRIHYIELNDPYIQMNNAHMENHSDYLAMLSPPDYGNLSSPEPHHYVNDCVPIPSPSLSPPNLMGESSSSAGYLPMDIFSPRTNESIFDFDMHKKQKSNGEPASRPELLPMLHITNDSDSDLSPAVPISPTVSNSSTVPASTIVPISPSFSNPSYQNASLLPNSDNYINMPQQKSALKQEIQDKEKSVIDAFSNPSYVQINNKSSAISDDDKNNYVNSQSRDWERPYVT